MGSQDRAGLKSEWLGSAADQVVAALVAAVCGAQAEAVEAHDAQGSTANDTYGHTLKVRVPELINQHLKGIPGVTLRKPAGVNSRFELPVIDETKTVLVPIRISNDPRKRHDDVLKIKMSDLRRTLLEDLARPTDPTLFDVAESTAFADDHAAALEAYEELIKAGRSVVVAVGASPSGLFELGLSDVVVNDADSGSVTWARWLSLPVSLADVEASAAPTLRVVPDLPETPRFDASDTVDDFDLQLRPTVEVAPEPEVPPAADVEADKGDSSS